MKIIRPFALLATFGLLASGHAADQANDTSATPAPPSETPAASLAEPAPAAESAAPAATPAPTPTTQPGEASAETAVPAVPADASPAPVGTGTLSEPAAEPAKSETASNLETYAIDPVHSNVGFRVKHLFSNVTGRFNDFSGTIVGDPAKPEEVKVNVEIKVASIDTKDAKRDQHLRSDEFFDVEKHPTIRFVGKKVHRTGEDTAFVTGDLTLRGVTKEVILQTKFLGRGKGMTGRIHTGFEAHTALKRSDFGLTWNKAIEGTQLVGDDIHIDLQIEAVEPKNEEAAPAVAPKPPERVLPEQDGVVPPTESAPSAPNDANATPATPNTPVAPEPPSAPAPSVPPAPSTPPAPEAQPAPSAPTTPVEPPKPQEPAAPATPPGAPLQEA